MQLLCNQQQRLRVRGRGDLMGQRRWTNRSIGAQHQSCLRRNKSKLELEFEFGQH
jgi:hypothetical protein